MEGVVQKRPYLASTVDDVHEADKWRQQILKEISKKVMEIQNAALGEHKIRDLNDEINKLIREKGHWEKQIVKLGGPDYAKVGAKVTDTDGNEVATATGRGAGYKYFGAAKTLPGVKELFDKPKTMKRRKTRAELNRGIDSDYFGLRDEEDGVLVRLEGPAEKRMRAALEEDWERREAEIAAARRGVRGGKVEVEGSVPEGTFTAYVPLPDDKDIEARVVAKKKNELLSKYMSDDLLRQQEQAGALLGQK